jgi:hypothetical protein
MIIFHVPITSVVLYGPDLACRWTSLVVAAEVFRFVVTQSEDAASNVWQYYGGMRNLNRVTGIQVRTNHLAL